jgi:acylglycerol lipase
VAAEGAPDMSALITRQMMVAFLSLSCLLGCASFERTTKLPIEPPRDGATWIQGTGGLRLYFSVKVPAGEPWGVLYFVSGPSIAAAEPYPKFTAALLASGIATAVLHPRGTGFSDGARGDIDDYRLFLDDLRLGLERVRKAFPGKAVFLLGHSAGGALALELAAKAAPPLAGVILVNPAYKLVYSEGMGPSLSDYVVYAFNAVFRRSALTVDMNSNPTAVKNDADREEGIRLQRDPLVVRYFSMRYMLAQREIMNACLGNVVAINAPLVVVQGAKDTLVDFRGNDEILAAAGTADKVKLVARKGAHGSSAVETVVEELLQWLRTHR